jgi:DNA polymerase I
LYLFKKFSAGTAKVNSIEINIPDSKTLQKKLILVDGNGLAYRAFYALPPLKTSNGEPVNAVYGFTNMLLKIIEKEKPDYIAVAFDKSRPTCRLEMFDEYKAHRQKMPDELRQQFAVIEEVVNVFRIPIFHVEGYEADDCLATLTRAAEEKGVFTRIYSGDLDMLQLVTENTEVVTTRRGISDLVIYDRDLVKKRYGIEPRQLVDYKALAGDSSDHIPGVPGIGEASASKLLNQFSDIESMYENVGEIPSRWKKQILDNKDQAFLSKRLVSLEKNLELDFDWEDLSLKDPDREELKKLFVKLEFKTLLKKMGFSEEELQEIQEIMIQIVGKDEDLGLVMDKLRSSGQFSIFWVTDEEENLIGLATGSGKTNGYYFPFALPEQLNISSTFGISTFSVDRVMHELKPLLEDSGLKKCAHNLKKGIRYLKRGEYFSGKNFVDTAVAARLLEPETPPKTLETIFVKYTDFRPKTMAEILNIQKDGKKKIRISEVPLQDLTLFIAGRAVRLNNLSPVLEEKLTEAGQKKFFDEVEVPLVSLLAVMEQRGVTIDTDALRRENDKLDARMEEIAQEIYRDSGQTFNINSTRQLSSVLFDRLNIRGISSTSAEALLQVREQHPVIDKILEYRENFRFKTSCIDSIKAKINSHTEKLHPILEQSDVETGRIVTVFPEFKSLPEHLLKLFVPSSEEKVLLGFEIPDLEMRMLAHFSEDSVLTDIFRNEQDLYSSIASKIFGVSLEEVTGEMRHISEKISSAVVNCLTPHHLVNSTPLDKAEVRQLMDNFFKEFSGVKNLIEASAEEARKTGFVETIIGRRKFISGLDEKKRNIRLSSERTAMSFKVRGSAGDLMKKAMVTILEEVLRGHRDIHMLFQVDDQMLFETKVKRVDKYSQKISDILKEVFTLKVPLSLKIKEGINWLEIKAGS